MKALNKRINELESENKSLRKQLEDRLERSNWEIITFSFPRTRRSYNVGGPNTGYQGNTPRTAAEKKSW